MSRTKKYLGLTILVLMIAALAVSSAFAQTATPPATTTTPRAHGGGFGRGAMCGQAGLDAAAQALNLTTEELTAQLWGGQTLVGLAEKAGVEITAVQSAVQAACQQAQIDAINQAVTDGRITRENADWLIEGIEKGYVGGKSGFGGFGMGGRGGHGFHGFGGFGVPKGTAPNTTPNSGSTSPSRFVF